MANTKSAEKRLRQTVFRTAVNRRNVSRYRTFVKKVEVAIESGDKAAAQAAFKSAEPIIQGSVSKGVVHRNLVARKLSRLSRRIKSMDAAAA